MQQSLEPKLSRRRYASVSYALQNSLQNARRTESVSVMDHKQTVGVNSIVLDQTRLQTYCKVW